MMRTMQKEMEGMHGGEAPRPLVSRLIDADRLSDAQRRELHADAVRRRDEGLRRLDLATRELGKARQQSDDVAVARAVAAVKEATIMWETGTTVLNALDSKAPREAGVQWFREQMRTLPRIEPDQLTAGLSWRHAVLMASLAAVVVAGLVLYAYKVRRSVELLRRAGGGTSAPR